jgi:predicted alpha-1,2-mannosidase
MSGYFYGDQKILGFSHTRLVGTGAIDGGNFLVVPATAALKQADLTSNTAYQFSHEQETAFPGYYAVWLPETQVLAELTASMRVGVHRYTFTSGQTPFLRLNICSALGKGRCTEGQVAISKDGRELHGCARTFGSFSSRFGGSKVYFAARLDRPVVQRRLWSADQLLDNNQSTSGDTIGVELQFAQADQSQSVQLQLAISYVSIENAYENLNTEVADKSFDQVLQQAIADWESKLELVSIEGGDASERTCFYTALYRSMNMPTTFSDVNGQYLGFDKQVHQASDFVYYTDMSLWDTFRTTHPLYTLLLPSYQRDMVVSLVEMSRQGGYLPRWPSGSGYTNSMFGTPADLVIAETYLKGIRDFDVETAYKKMLETGLRPTPAGAPFSGREGIDHYIRFGYCPSDLMKESVSRTLEYCYADYAIGKLAEALGHKQDAELFLKRAQSYKNLWNPQTQFFHPRDSQRNFLKDFRPLMLTYTDVTGKYTNAYVEGSAMQWRWAVPHDSDGLVELMGGRERFVEQLQEFFAKSTREVGRIPNAYYWQGNQPDLFAAFLFNSAGRPDLTQFWTRWILKHKYSSDEVGLDGNDDGGTLSAWYVLASLGIYPVAGTDRYELTRPLWQRAEIQLGDRPLVITQETNSSSQQGSMEGSEASVGITPSVLPALHAELNGQILQGTQISHRQLLSGGELQFLAPSSSSPSSQRSVK